MWSKFITEKLEIVFAMASLVAESKYRLSNLSNKKILINSKQTHNKYLIIILVIRRLQLLFAYQHPFQTCNNRMNLSLLYKRPLIIIKHTSLLLVYLIDSHHKYIFIIITIIINYIDIWYYIDF